MRDVLSSNSGGQIVAMMQAAKPWHGYYSATRFRVTHCFAAIRYFLRQRKMRPVVVIITDVLAHKAFQMSFAENDRVVEDIPAAVADPALGHAVLPRTSETGPLRLDAEGLHRVDHFFIELRAAIEDQIAGCRVVRKCLAQLLDHPGTGRMLGHIPMEDSPPIMRDDEEAVQNAKGERRHGKEVHRGDCSETPPIAFHPFSSSL